jgi:hypothetical protein
MHEPENTLARTSYKFKILSERIGWGTGLGRTFSVNPKKRTCHFPFPEDATLKKPGCCPLVMSTTRNVMAGRRIWWGEPFMEAVPRLLFCKDTNQAAQSEQIRLEDDERCIWSTSAFNSCSPRYIRVKR